ncbi:MAG: orotidine 5'-phosphate decarboxylase [Candidatus ainarchaeum sp.]|nr:orotidine 5'-phosphate decarboxylase [Candidatus ainarchaeum sp.]
MPGKRLVTPCVQVAVDAVEKRDVARICEALAHREGVIFEAGTPTIKQFGIGIVGQMRQMAGDPFIIADLKTLDVGDLEARIAKNGGADAAICSGLAGKPTVRQFVSECGKLGVLSFVDMMGVKDPVGLLESLDEIPCGASFHRGIDAELAGEPHEFDRLSAAKKAFPRLVCASAGGIDAEKAGRAVAAGADVVVVGRFITSAADPVAALEKIEAAMGGKGAAKTR